MPSARVMVQRLFSSASANALSVGANQGALLLAGVLVAQILGRDSFGRFSMLMVTALAFSSMGQLSLGITATKFIAELRANSPSFLLRFTRLVKLSAFGMGAGIACLVLLFGDAINTHAFARTSTTAEMWILVPIVAMQVIAAVLSSAIAGFEAFRAQANASWIGAAISVCLCAVLASTNGVPGALIGIGLGIAFRIGFSVTILHREVVAASAGQHEAVPPELLLRIRQYAIPAAFAGVTGVPAIWLAASALTREVGGVAEYAHYAAAYNIKTLMLFIPAIIAMVTVPRLSFYLAAGDDLHARKSFWVAVLVACLILLIGASIVILGAAPILSIFGTEFQSASRILTLVAITAIIEGLCIVSYSYFQAKGQLWLPFFIFAIPRDIALVAAAYVLCPRYGAMGLAFAALIAGTYTMCATFLLLLVRERSHLFARAQ